MARPQPPILSSLAKHHAEEACAARCRRVRECAGQVCQILQLQPWRGRLGTASRNVGSRHLSPRGKCPLWVTSGQGCHAPRHVFSFPQSRHSSARVACPLSANNGPRPIPCASQPAPTRPLYKPSRSLFRHPTITQDRSRRGIETAVCSKVDDRFRGASWDRVGEFAREHEAIPAVRYVRCVYHTGDIQPDRGKANRDRVRPQRACWRAVLGIPARCISSSWQGTQRRCKMRRRKPRWIAH